MPERKKNDQATKLCLGNECWVGTDGLAPEYRGHDILKGKDSFKIDIVSFLSSLFQSATWEDSAEHPAPSHHLFRENYTVVCKRRFFTTLPGRRFNMKRWGTITLLLKTTTPCTEILNCAGRLRLLLPRASHLPERKDDDHMPTTHMQVFRQWMLYSGRASLGIQRTDAAVSKWELDCSFSMWLNWCR